MHRHIIISISLVLLASAEQPSAEEIYTWTDAAGITHYSETPPPDPSLQARPIELPEPPPVMQTPDDYYSVINQLNRMQTQRLENEKLIAERKRAEAEARQAIAEAEAQQQEEYQEAVPSYYPAYPLYGYRPPYGWRPGKRPGNWPGHGPGRRPGHRPDNHPGRPGHLPAPDMPHHYRSYRRQVSF
jgi:hypothetical protein